MSKCLLTTRRDVLSQCGGRFLAKPRGACRERPPGGPKVARDICISLQFLFWIERFQWLATHPTGGPLPLRKGDHKFPGRRGRTLELSGHGDCVVKPPPSRRGGGDEGWGGGGCEGKGSDFSGSGSGSGLYGPYF